MEHIFRYQYLSVRDAELFTAVCLPADGKFPTVILRSPYVDQAQDMEEQAVCEALLVGQKKWLDRGYAVVFQHCRGRGKSSGDCIPYINEREDTLALYAWIREQDFYNGELFPVGRSYSASVHFVATPFASDIKGAVLEVQDCDRYNCNYRNGFYKMGLHGGWYVKMYKRKSIPQKSYAPESYHTLPLLDFSKAVLGESAADFDEILRHPDRNDPFWNTRYGGGEARDAVKHADIPILFTTGFYDIYTGGIFDMWNGLDAATKAKSALAVHPFDHSGKGTSQPVVFEKASLDEAFGDYAVNWLDHVRGKGAAPFAPGKVTYYRVFGEKWCTDDFSPPESRLDFVLGEGEKAYRYNPYAPASFKGGLSANFNGNAWQGPPDSRYDVLSFYTPAFAEDVFVKGKMSARLCVRSSCEDTCFYVRISLVKENGDYGLRDDIQQISNFAPDYRPGDQVMLDFSFDEHAFVIRKGEKLRIDVSSSAFPLYVRHTNYRGLYCEQTAARIADNTVVCDCSRLTVPTEPME